MTLEKYEKVLEAKRKAIQYLKTEGRKVDAKEFEFMQQLSNKKSNDEIFVKLGSDKDKRKETYEKEERAKKSLSINEFLKPAEGKRNHNPSGLGKGRGNGQDHGQGRGRGSRGFGGDNATSNIAAPSIEDPGQFLLYGPSEFSLVGLIVTRNAKRFGTQNGNEIRQFKGIRNEG